MNQFPKIDQSWTLFLDRDGVINERNFDGYILQWSDFHFTAGLLDAAAQIGQHFGRVFVVTNQQCVAKQLITESELAELHQKMKILLGLQRGIKVINNGLDIAGRFLITITPLKDERFIMQYGEYNIPIQSFPTAGSIFKYLFAFPKT